MTLLSFCLISNSESIKTFSFYNTNSLWIQTLFLTLFFLHIASQSLFLGTVHWILAVKDDENYTIEWAERVGNDDE